MTKAEMSQLQEVARKYSQYGYTLFEICELMDEQPKEYSFKRRLNEVRLTLCQACDCPEYFTFEDSAEILGIEVEELLNYVKENNIEYNIFYAPKPKDKGEGA